MRTATVVIALIGSSLSLNAPRSAPTCFRTAGYWGQNTVIIKKTKPKKSRSALSTQIITKNLLRSTARTAHGILF